MRLLFCGDIVGRSGRSVVIEHLPRLRRELDLDFVIANGENAAGGFGITAKICTELLACGVDVISGGNHSWDQREALTFIDSQPRLLRPQNYPEGTPGSSWATAHRSCQRFPTTTRTSDLIGSSPRPKPSQLTDP